MGAILANGGFQLGANGQRFIEINPVLIVRDLVNNTPASGRASRQVAQQVFQSIEFKPQR